MGEAGREALWGYMFEKLPDGDWHSYTQPFERTCHLFKSKSYKSFISAFPVFVPELFTADEAVGGGFGGLSTFARCQQRLWKS